jgi:hypothetical protein
MARIRIYTDESVNVAIAEGLKRRGLDVLSARDAGNLGLTAKNKCFLPRRKRLPYLPMIRTSSDSPPNGLANRRRIMELSIAIKQITVLGNASEGSSS